MRAYNSYLVNEKPYALAAIKTRLRELREQGRDVIDMTLGDPDDETCPAVRQAMIEYLEQHASSSYPMTQGSESYRAAVADRLQQDYGLAFSPQKHILSCLGTKEAICLLPLLFDWQKGDGEVFMPGLAYPVYKSSAQVLGVPFRELPVTAETNFFPDLDELTPDDLKRCKIFWLNSPHNPTGAIASEEYCRKLLSLAVEYDFLIASDEAYNELYFSERPFSFLEIEDETEHWIVFRTLSKRNNMTGYRAGAIITKNEELCSMLLKLRMPFGTGIPEPIAAGAEAAWKDVSHLNKNREVFKNKRDVLYSPLKKCGFHIHDSTAGFYLWLSHPKLPTSEELWNFFLDSDLVLTPGTAFGPDGEGYIRLTFACDLSLCETAAERIHKMNI